MTRAIASTRSWKFVPLALGIVTTNASLSAATWPSAGCAGTLQACIDGAASGEVVEIATNVPITESPEINAKSLTLRAATGFAPVFAAGSGVLVSGGAVTTTVVVEGVTIADGHLRASQDAAGTLDITLRNNVVLDTPGSGVEVSSVGGPVRFDVSDNRIAVVGFGGGDQVSAITIGPFQSDSSGRVSGNVLRETVASTQNAVIQVAGAFDTLTADILGNDIGGQGFSSGISVVQSPATGSTSARVINNLVRGGGSGIVILGVDGALSAVVVNNTVVNGAIGINVSGSPGGSLSGVVANNIVAGHANAGVQIEAIFEATFPNDHNLVFGNGSDEEFTPGPGTVFADPMFVGASDFHLLASSPALNAGASAQVPGDIAVDLDGLPRIQGVAVEIGAYEGVGKATEVPALGPWGVVVLVGGFLALSTPPNPKEGEKR